MNQVRTEARFLEKKQQQDSIFIGMFRATLQAQGFRREERYVLEDLHI